MCSGTTIKYIAKREMLLEQRSLENTLTAVTK